jgi:hypothetical protein
MNQKIISLILLCLGSIILIASIGRDLNLMIISLIILIYPIIYLLKFITFEKGANKK